MKKIFLSIVTLFLILSCNLTTEKAGVGTMNLTISNSLSRTITPGLDMTIDKYDITATGPNSESFSYADTELQSIKEPNLAIGKWNITVNAKNSAKKVIATAKTDFTISDNRETPVNLIVKPISGTGVLDLKIIWPNDGSVLNPVIEASLTPQNKDTQEIIFPINANTASYNNASLETGYYTLNVKLKDDAKYLWGMVKSIRILNGETSANEITLTSSDINPIPVAGSLNLTISNDMDNPLNVTLSGTKSAINIGEEITVTANVPENVDRYTWYVNGEWQSNTGNTLTLGSNLKGGSYRVDLTVNKDWIQSSTGFYLYVNPLTVGLTGSAAAVDFGKDLTVSIDSLFNFDTIKWYVDSKEILNENGRSINIGSNLTSGNHTVMAEVTRGKLTNYAEFSFTVNELVLTASNTYLDYGDKAHFKVAYNPSATYKWYVDNKLITGEDSYYLYYGDNSRPEGSPYYVRVEVTNGTIITSATKQFSTKYVVGGKGQAGGYIYHNEFGYYYETIPDISIGQDEHRFAISKCGNLSYGGFSDWSLPSIYQLEKMYANLKVKGIGKWAEANYWSSDEGSATSYTSYRTLNFSNGNDLTYNETNSHYIKPYRKF